VTAVLESPITSKLITPLEYPLIILVVGFLAVRFGWFADADANANPRRKGVHKMDPYFYLALYMAFIVYAQAWHSEIGEGDPPSPLQ